MFILLLFNLIKTCPLESTYASINNLNALIPINHIINQLKNTITLQSNSQFSNLTLNQKIIDYTQLNVGEIQFTFNSILAFQFINNTYQSIGYAVIENVTLNMQFQFNNQQYDLQSFIFQIPNTFTNVQTMFYYTYYQILVNQLNAQLIIQIQNVYNGLQFTLPIYSDQYLYEFTNINGNVENINFIYQQSQESYQNYTLISYGQLNINQYDQNICNNVTLPNNISSFPQVQVFSNSIIQTIIQYGYQQNYFNTILNQNWKSQDFQFYVESLQYLFYNLDQFDLYTPITGYCNLTSLPLYNMTSILLQYGCNLIVEDQSIIQIQLNLTLNLKFQQTDTQIQVLCQDYTFTSNKIYNAKFKPKVQSLQLDYYIIQSILNTHLKNTQLFGSGFKTIPRRNGTIHVTSDYLMIFDY